MSTHLYGSSPKTAAQLVSVANLKGENGITFINDTTPKTGEWNAIQCIAACTFSTLICPENDGADMSTVTLAAGTTIYGKYTSITLATGSVIAYRS